MDKTTGCIAFIIQILSIISFWRVSGKSSDTVKNGASLDHFTFSGFQHIQCVVFLGFGFIASQINYTTFFFMIIAIDYSLIWDTIIDPSAISIHSFYKGVREALLVAITMKILANKLTTRQLIVVILLEIPMSKAVYRVSKLLQVTDAGSTISIHLFGSYFALAVAKIMGRQESVDVRRQSDVDMLAHIGGIFLWLYWPSFNGIETASALGSARAVNNTYLSLMSCGVATFALTSILGTCNRVHLIYATVAGGISIGSIAQFILSPSIVLIIGTLTSIITILGFKYFQSTGDPHGIHNIHGLPSIFGGFLTLLATATVRKEDYQKEFYDIFPACSPRTSTPELRQLYLDYLFVRPGEGRSIQTQIHYQLIYFVATFILAVISGLIIGLVLRSSPGLKSDHQGKTTAQNDENEIDNGESNSENMHNRVTIV